MKTGRRGGIWVMDFREKPQHEDPAVEETCPDVHTPSRMLNALG
jgi:hypothetical protein